MRTVGEILKKARLEKKIVLEDVEKNLKIRKKFLIALEENAWDKLPSLPYIKGFLRSYSNYLGLKSEEMVAIFRRQFQIHEKAGLLPPGLPHPLDEPIIHVTPPMVVIAVIFSFLTILFGYLFFQYKLYTNPPSLTIIKPLEGEIITTSKVEVSGQTDRDAVISVNDQKIAIDDNGGFSTILTLTPGVNAITIESTSKYGKKKFLTRTIQVSPI